jgi:hypothetical protein
MTKQALRFWGAFLIAGLATIFFLQGCVEIGGSTAEVCSGTECGTHDESDSSVDNTNNSNQNATY